MLEPGSAPDTKEAIYIGQHLPAEHPRVQRKEYNCGPNLYPASLGDEWHETCMEYLRAMTTLSRELMRALALSLELPQTFFDDFAGENANSTLRMIHYPPTPQSSDQKSRGVGAHRDFGCLTLLLQDSVGGLQVQDETKGQWLDVTPVPGVYVVNLGNLISRWTNHHYISNTHRVLNFSGRDRYSIPFFFSGDVSHTASTLPGLEVRRDLSARKFGLKAVTAEAEEEGDNYRPILVRDFLKEQFDNSYSRAREY